MVDMLSNFIQKGNIILTRYGPASVIDVNTYGVVLRGISGLQKNQYLSWPDFRLRLNKGQILVKGLDDLIGQTNIYKDKQTYKFI